MNKKSCKSILFLSICLLVSTIFAAKSDLPNFTEIITKNSPAVVNISTMRTKKNFDQLFQLPPGMEGTPQGELFRKFFEDQIKPHGNEALSLGSGLIISSDGYIVTNNHVISEADRILVKLSDKREYPAKLVGADKGTDIALLKINAKDLQYSKLGNSDNLMVGEWVVAIGSPFGFEYSSTAGIVSGKGRSIGRERYVPFIQTDVAINPGNSGGPLFNLEGEVVGINAQILSKSGGYLGLSFAIPSNVVHSVVLQLQEKGYVSRGWLGIQLQPVDRDIAESFGLDRATGALVANIVSGSPAEQAGIKSGDIVTKFNGEAVDDHSTLPSLVGNIKPGTKADVEIYREGKKQQLSVVIGELEVDQVSKAEGYTEPQNSGKYNRLGMNTRDLNKEERTKLNVPKGGVIISEVELESISESIGLAPGDVILSLNMKAITDNKQFDKLVKELPKEKWIPILVKSSGGITRYFPFKITK